MRGVLGLAAALSIPGTLADGRAFPGRDLILFLTFSVILVTLVLQGLTLPLLIRFLGLGGADEDHREEACARLSMRNAARAYLDAESIGDSARAAMISSDLVQDLELHIGGSATEPPNVALLDRADRLTVILNVLKVQREAILDLRNQGRINDRSLPTLERDLDLRETQALDAQN